MIIVMDKGHVKWVGSSTDLSASSYSAFSPLNELDINSHIYGQESSVDTCTEDKQNLLLEKTAVCASDGAQEIIEDEVRKEGRVEFTVYK